VENIHRQINVTITNLPNI